MFATRRFASAAPRAIGAARSFKSSARFNVAVGDSIPSVELVESSPGNKVDLAKELKTGKGVVVGVPAAFSMLMLSPPTHGTSDSSYLRLTRIVSDPKARRVPAPTCPVMSTTRR